MLIYPGNVCMYVAENMDRVPVRCEIARSVDESEDYSIYLVDVLGSIDKVVGSRFFAEVRRDQKLLRPNDIVPVYVFVKEGGWRKSSPSFGSDIVENGFLCNLKAMDEFFPQYA